MREHCGVVAVMDLAGKSDVVPEAVTMLRGLQHRGELGAGIAWLDDNGEIQVLKHAGLVQEALSNDKLRTVHARSSAVVAHVRYATNEHLSECMAQPYVYKDPSFAFAFNGNIANYETMSSQLRASGNGPQEVGDTEVVGRTIMNLLRDAERTTIERALRGLDVLDGSFNVVMLHQSGIEALVDKHGFRPLSRARTGSKVAVASEDQAIRAVWQQAHCKEVDPGWLLHASLESRDVTDHQLWIPEEKHCFFEWIYFASHLARLRGTSVANARFECGKILAGMDMRRGKDDIVVPVPESAKIASNGYADTRGLRRVDGILKNAKVGRTFISATDREAKARMKYDIDEVLLRGRSIVLVDDSIVRGTTMRVLVEQLRRAGVEAIHLRLASPPIVSPCFYGIDFPTVRELIARKYSDGSFLSSGELPPDVLAAIAHDLGVDSVRFLPWHALSQVIGMDIGNLCTACVTKEYPTPEGARLAALAEQDALVQLSPQTASK